MPRIYELLGYPISDNSRKVQESRKRAYCPFVSGTCDGGGNRFMSEIDLSRITDLQPYFPNLDRVASGICSIQLSEDSAPWIICPRRLLYLGKKANNEVLRGITQMRLLQSCGFSKGTSIGIWAETKVRYSVEKDDEEETGAFDYTFDYVLMPIGGVSLQQASIESGISINGLRRLLEKNGYTLSMRDGQYFVENFPIGSPVIVEVMTSSTSGGNKKKRSCIPQAFEDCILGKKHTAPGINYRQVWARMASQMIVKSQAAMSWNGKTIWVLQDVLADYISSSTALDLKKFVAEHTDEVNILAFSYGDNYISCPSEKTVDLDSSVLYAGPIKSKQGGEAQPCFQDIVLASICPPRSVLIAALCKKAMANTITLR